MDTERDCEDMLKDLNYRQKTQVLEWVSEFRLSLNELATWRKDREDFVKSVKYRVPVDSPVDLICRDIYELKLFGARVADFFHKNGQPLMLKMCGRVFTREEAMRWAVIKPHLLKPFKFSAGEPQRVLNELAADSRPFGKRTRSSPGKETTGPKKHRETIIRGESTESPKAVEHDEQDVGNEDRKPTEEELLRAAASFAPDSAKRDLPDPASSVVPKADELPCGTSTVTAKVDRATEDAISRTAYAVMVEKYLAHFKIEPKHFSDWLLETDKTVMVSHAEIFARADDFITSIANTLCELALHPSPKDESIASYAQRLKVPEDALRMWNSPDIRGFFSRDKTALKYDLFGRVFPPPDHKAETYLPKAERMIRYRTRSDFSNVTLSDNFREDRIENCTKLVSDVMRFYSLDSDILDELPIECDSRSRKGRRAPALQLLLHELGILISDLNEISMFSELFSREDTAFCFEERWLAPQTNLYFVTMQDAVKAVNRNRQMKTKLHNREGQDVLLEKIRNVLTEYKKGH
ncbi:uncharacterized protein LOC100901360 [Galendromus occidentalis]|uniref:Uncharacterized protein LOC100901360 n=1 Tax=Galendromus occidentalis TaxID=34638 RepID=A0AAJ7L507_9ACAR|nr:uncharacterized protein LOC100901360 [Galendromus occidentalis]